MKIFDKIKKNKIMILLYFFLILYYCFCWYNYRVLQDGATNQKMSYEHYSICERYLSSNENERIQIIKEYGSMYGIDVQECEKLTSYKTTTHSTYNIFETFLITDNYLFPFFVPLVVIIPFLYVLSKEFKSKYIKNYCMRASYKEYKRHIFKTSYQNIFVIPVVIGITFLISYIISNGNINPIADQGLNYVLPDIVLFLDSKLFWLFYVLVLLAGIGLFINVGVIVLSKNKNFIIALIESELIIFLIWCFSEICLGLIGSNIFNIDPGNFNLLSIYNWNGVTNMYIYTLLNIVLYIISLIIAILSYKNKEKIIIMCEK